MAVQQNQTGILATSYGTIWNNAGNFTGTTFAFTTSYQELTSIGVNWTLASVNIDFAMTTDGRLKYTGVNPRTFAISSYFSVGNTGSYATALYKNGSLITGAESPEAGSGTSVAQTFVSLATNDYISLFAKRASGGSNNILQLSLGARSVS